MEEAVSEGKGVWRLEVLDTLSNKRHFTDGEYPNEEAAVQAAKKRLKQLERKQPSQRSDRQSGIQYQVFVRRPNRTRFCVFQ